MKKRPEDFEQVCDGIAQLSAISDAGDADRVREVLRATVPEYMPDTPTDTPAPASPSKN